MTAQVHASHAPRLTKMGKWSFKALAPVPATAVYPGSADAPAIEIDGVARRGWSSQWRRARFDWLTERALRGIDATRQPDLQPDQAVGSRNECA
jgi:hypothetical protein